MQLIEPLAEQYAEAHSGKVDRVISELEAYTKEHHPHAHMLSGSLQGKLLEMIVLMTGATRILEIGTFTGYSALCLAKGLGDTGVLHTIELREADAQTARQFFDKSGMGNKIISHTGQAADIIPKLTETWDLVFIDADKVSYIDYYELTLPGLKKGGWMLADNVLFHGEVLGERVSGKNPKAIDAFNKHVAADSRVDKLMLTIRDGLTLIRKL